MLKKDRRNLVSNLKLNIKIVSKQKRTRKEQNWTKKSGIGRRALKIISWSALSTASLKYAPVSTIGSTTWKARAQRHSPDAAGAAAGECLILSINDQEIKVCSSARIAHFISGECWLSMIVVLEDLIIIIVDIQFNFFCATRQILFVYCILSFRLVKKSRKSVTAGHVWKSVQDYSSDNHQGIMCRLWLVVEISDGYILYKFSRFWLVCIAHYALENCLCLE